MDLLPVEILRIIQTNLNLSSWKVWIRVCKYFNFIPSQNDIEKRIEESIIEEYVGYLLPNENQRNQVINLFKKVYAGIKPGKGCDFYYWNGNCGGRTTLLELFIRFCKYDKVQDLHNVKNGTHFPLSDLIISTEKYYSITDIYTLKNGEKIYKRNLYESSKEIIPNWHIILMQEPEFIDTLDTLDYSYFYQTIFFTRNFRNTKSPDFLTSRWLKDGILRILKDPRLLPELKHSNRSLCAERIEYDTEGIIGTCNLYSEKGE